MTPPQSSSNRLKNQQRSSRPSKKGATLPPHSRRQAGTSAGSPSVAGAKPSSQLSEQEKPFTVFARASSNSSPKINNGAQLFSFPAATAEATSAKSTFSPATNAKTEAETTEVVELKAAAATPGGSAKTEESSRRKRKRQTQGVLSSLGLTVLRLTVFGVCLSAIAGTVLANQEYTTPMFANLWTMLQRLQLSLPSVPGAEPSQLEPPAAETAAPSQNLEQEITSLKAKFEALATQYTKLEPGAFFIDLDNQAYVNFGGDRVFSAASTIKVPVLIAFFQEIDAKKIRLDEKLTMSKEVIGGGSGSMQYQEPGTQFTALETATRMIAISDNTATNMLIERLGGAEALNQRFKEWGLTNTAINNPLPDLEGTNTTSPKDLANLLAMVERGELVSLRSRDRLLDIMQQTVTRTLLPQGLEKDAIIAHKTGDIGTVIGDTGIVDMPNGKRYIAAVLVNRPHNDPDGRTLIQQMSKAAYQHFKWYLPSPIIHLEVQSAEEAREQGSAGAGETMPLRR